MSIKTRYADGSEGPSGTAQAAGPPALGYPWTAMCVSREGVHFLLTLSRGEAPREGALDGRQKEPEDLSSSLSLDLAGASLCPGGACWSLRPYPYSVCWLLTRLFFPPGPGFGHQGGQTAASRHAGNQSRRLQRNRPIPGGEGQEATGEACGSQ